MRFSRLFVTKREKITEEITHFLALHAPIRNEEKQEVEEGHYLRRETEQGV